MDTVLLIIGLLGLGTMMVAAYVFTVSARNYVSEDTVVEPINSEVGPASAERIMRSEFDRRKNSATSFPITVNGVLIEDDRRTFPERRFAA